MARPSLSKAKREKFVPIIASCFAERGYRRTTTAELAEACGVQETILYRLWSGKKRMFLAAIEYVYQNSARIWLEVADRPAAGGSTTERLLEYESRHLGEFGLYRIIFAGLSEVDDPEIRTALRRMFRGFHKEISDRIAEHQPSERRRRGVDIGQTAWAFVGLGLIANLSRDVKLFGEQERRALIAEVGRLLLEGESV